MMLFIVLSVSYGTPSYRHNPYPTRPHTCHMKFSTLLIVGGIILAVLPIPGTIILGGLAVFIGIVARLLGV